MLNVKLSETDDGKYVSVLELPASVLIIPQATLGGRIKGKNVQYHKNIEKERGKELYQKFIELIEQQCAQTPKWSETGCVVKSGTYGIWQVYSTETNGPYLHFVEI